MDPEDEEIRRLLARRILRQLLGAVPGVNPELAMAGGDTVAAGRPQRDTQINAGKKGANFQKSNAQAQARRTGVGIERAPVEFVLPDAPVTPGSGVQRIERTTRPLTPAELFRNFGR